MKKQGLLENRVKVAYLGIGSNLGNKMNYINKAKFKLKLNNIEIIKSSSNYESLSWPNPKNPKFINIVIKIKTKYSPTKLLSICKKIEIQLDRKPSKKNSPRTCDIDIIDYDNSLFYINKGKLLNLPHPLMTKRNFVLLPLYEISKTWIHPKTKINIKKLINSLNIKDLRSIKYV